MNSHQEKQCIKAVLLGDPNAYAKLVDAHKDYVFTLCVRIVGDRQVAEEVAQDTFLKAYSSLSTFKAESKFTTWIYRIAYNTSLDYLKKKKNDFLEINEGSTILSRDTDGLTNLILQERREIIKQLIAGLPKIDSLILSLYYFDEKSTLEIGEIVSIKPNSVKQKLHRARQALGKQLEKHNITLEAHE